MARIHRRTPATLEPIPAHIDGEQLLVTLVRPDTPTLLDFTAAWARFHRVIKEAAGNVSAAAYNELLDGLLKSVADVSPLEDEDGATVAFGELPRGDQLAVLAALHFGDVMTLGTALVKAGRLSAEEKKPSAPTSSTSTAEAPAAVPPAAPAAPSQG